MAETTIKKIKYVGTEQFINVHTGEVEEFQVTSIQERDFNFHKVWMKSLLSTIELVGNQKIKLAFWIIDHLNRENMLTMTYRQISQNAGISLETVRVTMKILMDENFLKRVNMGCYMVNPDILYKGTRTSRLNVLNQYSSIKDAPKNHPITDKERIENLTNTINALMEELDRLTKKASQQGEVPDPTEKENQPEKNNRKKDRRGIRRKRNGRNETVSDLRETAV